MHRSTRIHKTDSPFFFAFSCTDPQRIHGQRPDATDELPDGEEDGVKRMVCPAGGDFPV
jgi:hypothetical protein